MQKPLTAVAGLVLEFGHGGYSCSYSTTPPRPMCIISEHGVHDVAVRFCACRDRISDKPAPKATQLLRYGFWPASWDKPHTAFTIPLLKLFALLCHQANVSAYDFYKVMRCKTDNIEPHEVTVWNYNSLEICRIADKQEQDRYREFMTAARTFDHITNLKRHGRKVRELVYASLAILCPACPQPDINMEPGWQSRAEDLRCEHDVPAVHYCANET